MGNQAEFFENGGDDHDMLENASLDAKNDSNGYPAGHINGGSKDDTNSETGPSHETGAKGNPNLRAILPDGSYYDEESEDDEGGAGADADAQKVNPPQDTNAPSEIMGVGIGVGIAKKKKKTKGKSKSKRGLTAPTGFEEFYVDAPVTPAEYEEEKGLYHGSLLFSERIQTAIQRYWTKRNFNSERKDVFDKYMAYGGIDSGPKMFSGGLDANTLSTSNAADIATKRAIHYVPTGRGESDDPSYVVDFEGCTQGFLSSRLPSVFDLLQQDRIKSFTAIVRNFLNYILHHDVCPEHNDQIQAARHVCDQAEWELWEIAQAEDRFPGDFNRACSEIFGGIYQGLYIGNQEWAKGIVGGDGGISPDAARKTFRFALTALGSDDMCEQYASQSRDRNICVTSVFDANLEVTETIMPDKDTLALYKANAGQDLKPVGKLRAKSWRNPFSSPDDLTEEEEAAGALCDTGTTGHYEFWIEEDVLRHCFVGMKLETKVHRTSFGVDYFDAITGVWCSFLRVLPNELVIGWRDPGPRLPMRETPGGEGGGVKIEKGYRGDEGEEIV